MVMYYKTVFVAPFYYLQKDWQRRVPDGTRQLQQPVLQLRPWRQAGGGYEQELVQLPVCLVLLGQVRQLRHQRDKVLLPLSYLLCRAPPRAHAPWAVDSQSATIVLLLQHL
ncbi:hypothetical protein HPB49_017262 [Dermacentor silvarum]|uniref:Uncharacterized protein n=1 Tax=Dermacentor silvarum TaxID=543639 RepID=A0ACB8E1Q9_DERSI|nr:hypothetical protein HPB49_017262 [Dermacentor silvarum]